MFAKMNSKIPFRDTVWAVLYATYDLSMIADEVVAGVHLSLSCVPMSAN
jgi:hypothetical protein